ncbi:MAG: lytic transglycosylase domain-containing protein [Gammaproteobacteria bacterium]|nr:lytic transglycosylase domain-containing protein [Gammaproteobacteria bacterium]
MNKRYSIILMLCLFIIAPCIQASDSELRAHLLKALDSEHQFNDRFEAEVWLMDMSQRLSRFVKKNKERIELLKTVHSEARKQNLPPELVLAIIEVESGFNRYAISKAGAQGLMQVMPFWLKEIGRPKDNLFNIKTNLRMGCSILKFYLDKEKGELAKALARYNGSRGSYRYPNKVIKALNQRWFKS